MNGRIGALLSSLVFVAAACGARTDLGGHVASSATDASATDASEERAACANCGGESTGDSCTLWVYCGGETDGSTILCNDAPHQLDCSCAAASCTCSTNGATGMSVPFTTCPCDGPHFGHSEVVDPLVAACAF